MVGYQYVPSSVFIMLLIFVFSNLTVDDFPSDFDTLHNFLHFNAVGNNLRNMPAVLSVTKTIVIGLRPGPAPA
jgi:branched-subunit amino acid transport protein AzlD